MTEFNWAEHRKAAAFVVTAMLTILLRKLGLLPDDLPSAIGIGFADLQNIIVEVIWGGVLPGFVGWAWPNDPDAGILDYWRLALGGVAAIVAAGVVVALL